MIPNDFTRIGRAFIAGYRYEGELPDGNKLEVVREEVGHWSTFYGSGGSWLVLAERVSFRSAMAAGRIKLNELAQLAAIRE